MLFGKKKRDEVYLDEVIQGIGESVARAKVAIDAMAIKARRESYRGDEMMKMLPFMTFKISDVAVDLKFMVVGLDDEKESKQNTNDDDAKTVHGINNDNNNDVNLSKIKKRVAVNMDLDDLSKANSAIVCNLTCKLTQRVISEYSLKDKNIVWEHQEEDN